MNKVLVLVDYQNDFVTGVLGTKEAQAIENNIVEKINNHKGLILVTLDTHDKNYLNTREGKALPIEHCIIGTQGHEVPDKINNALKNALDHSYQNVYVVGKETFAPRISDLLSECVKSIQIADEIELIGVCTDICVLSTAITMHTLNHKADIIIDASCCAGTTVENHNKALDIMQNSLLMKVINRREVSND